MLDPKKHFAPNEPILDGLGFAIIHSVKGVEIVKVKPNLQAAQKISRRAISSLKSINMPSIRLGNSMIELLKPRKRKQKILIFLPRNGELRFAALPLNCQKPAIAKPPTAATVTKTPKDNNE